MKHRHSPLPWAPGLCLATNAQDEYGKFTAISSKWRGFIKVSPTTNEDKWSRSQSHKYATMEEIHFGEVTLDLFQIAHFIHI